MAYEVDAQAFLKGIIEEKLSGGAAEEGEENHEDEEDVVEFTVEDVPPPAAPLKSTVVADSEEKEKKVFSECGTCSSCSDKDSQLRRVQQEFSQSSKKFQEEISRLKEENSVILNKNVDMEIQIMQKESAIFEKELAVKEFEALQEKLETVTQRNNKLEEQVLVLQDEIELLKPQAAKLDFAEAQVDRFRAKLDELSDIKQQLKVESANHTETFQKLTALEQEVDGLRKLKPQLDEYRAQFAESAIASQELQMRLEASEELAASLKSENAALRGGQTDNRQQTQQLAEELRTTAEQLRERERTNGIGEGMSELNPALMQELNRLRSENKDLLEKLDATALGALDALRKDIAEQKCVNASLQKKWMATKDALEQANRDIQSLTFRLFERDSEHAALKGQLAEAAAMHVEDQSARRRVHVQQLQFCAKKHADALSLTHAGHNAVFGIYAQSLSQAHSTLEATQQTVVEITALQESTAEELAGTQELLEEAGRKRKFMEVEHEEEMSQLQDEFASTLEAHAKKHKAEVSALEQQASHKIAELTAQVEQDENRIRQLNNQKRVQEQEVARLKTQLYCAKSSDAVGEGLSDALSEMKNMEQELKDARNEISTLRSKVVAASEGKVLGSSAAVGAPVSALGAPARMTASVADHAQYSEASMGALGYAGYLEQNEIAEKRIQKLIEEKRELISKGLEETREKHEIQQKYLAMDKELAELKAEKRKIELENRRMDARLDKLLSAQGDHGNKENVAN
jgi:chromosome segregation ATPase